MSDEEDNAPTLGEFLEKEYEKFAIIGIFVTVSVFVIGRFPAEMPDVLQQATIVASLLILLLATAWLLLRTVNVLFEHTNELPLGTKIGYLVLITGIGNLAVAIGTSTTRFDEGSLRLYQLIGFGAVLLFYNHHYPTQRFRRRDVGAVGGAAIAITGFVPPVYDILNQFFGDNLIQSFELAVFIAISLSLLHLFISESLVGLHYIWHTGIEKIEAADRRLDHLINQLRNLEDPYNLFQQWPTPAKVSLSLIPLFLLTLLGSTTNEGLTGARELWIHGEPWDIWIMYHWAAITLAFLITLQMESGRDEELRNKWMLVYPGFALLCIVEAVLLYTGAIGEFRQIILT